MSYPNVIISESYKNVKADNNLMQHEIKII